MNTFQCALSVAYYCIWYIDMALHVHVHPLPWATEAKMADIINI